MTRQNTPGGEDHDTSRRPAQSRDLSPDEARELFLDKRRLDSSPKTIRTYDKRLDHFVEWCDDQGVDRVGDLTGWDLEQFEMSRRHADIAPTTLKGELAALRVLLKYCARIEAVDDLFYERVKLPNLSREEESSDVRLATENAKAILTRFRDSTALYGTNHHAFIELAWNTAARVGGIRALDLDDYSSEDGYLAFRHRPPETPLKNKVESERAVSIAPVVCEVLDIYIARERWDKRDGAGREPLFTSRQGRASMTTLRVWSYLATQPCVYTSCPHGKHRETCSFTRRNQASKCPSARSPHPIRTGSITWQSNWAASVGIHPEVISERVDASQEVIKRHYDKATELEKLIKRRQNHTETLDIMEFE